MIYESPVFRKPNFFEQILNRSFGVLVGLGIGLRHNYLLQVRGRKIAIRTRRVFRKIDGRWRQVHHYGSIDDPESLANYQSAVGKPDKVVGMQ